MRVATLSLHTASSWRDLIGHNDRLTFYITGRKGKDNIKIYIIKVGHECCPEFF